jgi:hypothetical protein
MLVLFAPSTCQHGVFFAIISGSLSDSEDPS